MELDLCIVDGNPCEQNSMYCSDACKELDIMEHRNVFFDGDDDLESLVASPLETPMEFEDNCPDYLLYECALCNSTHTASTPCAHSHSNYTTEPDYLNLNSSYIYYQDKTSKIPDYTTIRNNLQNNTEDSSLITNNKHIQSNYRKWLDMSNQ